MNVHVVCRNINEDRVLARLTRYLMIGNSWTASASPDPNADLNYFIVYIDYAERFSDWHATPIAAYFSHYEGENSFKRLWWENADQSVDIRVVTSDLAVAHLHGSNPIVKVRPPVDSQFKYRQPRTHLKPKLGFSGYVDERSDRKGVDLVKRLVDEHSKDYTFAASGFGWPVPTKTYAFNELVRFYSSLDVLVCTSRVEGIPMPPLEALACGVPIVIPNEVGILDDIPIGSNGVFRYKRGDYETLVGAIEQALVGTKPDHDVVGQYSINSWCSDHIRGFESALAGMKRVSVIESDRHGMRGVVYVAYGDPARKCAQSGIASFRSYMKDIPVALISAEPLGIEDVFIQHGDDDIGARSAKTLIDELAPKEWQYVMYLDADTEVIAPIDFLFNAVEDGFDIVICKNPGKYHIARQMIRSDNRDECDYTFDLLGSDELIQLNGGMFVFQRNDRTHSFFSSWHEEWKRWGKRDQGALLRALFSHPLKMLVLGNEWNTITRYDPSEMSAGILHFPMTARRWRGLVHGRSDSAEAWKAVMK